MWTHKALLAAIDDGAGPLSRPLGTFSRNCHSEPSEEPWLVLSCTTPNGTTISSTSPNSNPQSIPIGGPSGGSPGAVMSTFFGSFSNCSICLIPQDMWDCSSSFSLVLGFV